MQPDDNQSNDAPEPISIGVNDNQLTGSPQSIVIDPTTGLPQNVIIIEQPSSASNVVGILVIIFSVLMIIGEVFTIGGTLALGGFFVAMSILNLGINGGLIAGGIMMTQYKKKGIHICLAMIVASAIIGMVSLTLVPDMLDDIAEEENMDDEEREELEALNGAVMGVGAVFTIVCNGICGLIVAIPLMVSNNGLDDSKLFG